jgi:hypothetical protein
MGKKILLRLLDLKISLGLSPKLGGMEAAAQVFQVWK